MTENTWTEIEFDGVKGEVRNVGVFDESETGDSYTAVREVSGPVVDYLRESPGLVNQFLNDWFPGVHCQHSHDCCGCWYPRRGWIPGGVGAFYGNLLVVQDYQQNV